MTTPRLVRSLLPVLAGLLPSVVSAQTSLYTKLGDAGNDRLGLSVRSAGDVNQDGHPDFIAGAPQDGNVFTSSAGYARVFSGIDGTTLFTKLGESANDRFGTSVSGAGDVNADGYADFVVGAPLAGSGTGKVYVYSGHTGALLWSATGGAGDQLGTVVAGVGDVNNDGYDDFLAASPIAAGGGTSRGVAIVYSGHTGAVLLTINGAFDGDYFGFSAAGVGDVNGDGHKDFVVGSLFVGATLYSGANGSVLRTFTAPMDDRLGYSVAGAGDVDGDGVPDILVGAPQDGNIFGPGNGYAVVYSGATGLVIRTLSGGASGDRFGSAVGGARDMNNDGHAEILVGADQFTTSGPGYARLFNGADGSVVHTFLGLSQNERFGASVDGLGDLNGNGDLEIAIAAPDAGSPASLAGRVEVWSSNVGGCPSPYTFCGVNNNSTGQPALMAFGGSTSIAANNLTLVASGCPSNTVGLFYYGPAEIQQIFGNGFRCVGGSVFRLPIGSTSGAGIATRRLNYASLPPGGQVSVGSTWKFQFWYRNAAAGGANFNLSNGLSVTFCN
jgi:hypothetical protein